MFPESIANRILLKNISLLIENDIGLIAVSKDKSRRLIKAQKNESMKNHIRLLNLAKSLTCIDSSKNQVFV